MEYGFVYIWFDSKRRMFYIGSHWGTEDDGYVCSSGRMRKAYRRRPEDFKRRILSRVHTNRNDLLDAEQKWLDLALKKKACHYNLHYKTRDPWWATQETNLTVGQKISKALKGRKLSEERRQAAIKNLKLGPESTRGTTQSDEHIQKRMESMGEVWNKGLSKDDPRVASYAEKSKETRKGVKHPWVSERNNTKVTCPHCNKEGGSVIMKRWHFDNCKEGCGRNKP